MKSTVAGEQFDAVMGLEIIEHVDQPQQFLKALASLTKSDGPLFISTISRTPRGYALAILGAEYIARALPKGTHDWDKFITPGWQTPGLIHIVMLSATIAACLWHPNDPTACILA